MHETVPYLWAWHFISYNKPSRENIIIFMVKPEEELGRHKEDMSQMQTKMGSTDQSRDVRQNKITEIRLCKFTSNAEDHLPCVCGWKYKYSEIFVEVKKHNRLKMHRPLRLENC